MKAYIKVWTTGSQEVLLPLGRFVVSNAGTYRRVEILGGLSPGNIFSVKESITEIEALIKTAESKA